MASIFLRTLIAEKAEDANLLPPENVLPQCQRVRGMLRSGAAIFAEGEIETRNNPGRRALIR